MRFYLFDHEISAILIGLEQQWCIYKDSPDPSDKRYVADIEETLNHLTHSLRSRGRDVILKYYAKANATKTKDTAQEK